MRSWLAATARESEHPDIGALPLPADVPRADDLRHGVQALESQLRPASYEHVLFCVGKLITGFNERLTKDEAKARARLWQSTLSDLPEDLWSAATIELLRGWKRDDHHGRVPEASDVLGAVKERLDRRQADLRRVRQALNRPAIGAPPPAPAKVLSPEQKAAELRKALEEQRGRADLTDAERLHVMAHTERSLALYERRPMSDWAAQFFDDRQGLDVQSVGLKALHVARRAAEAHGEEG